ncbi:MAG: hypothetical protein Q7J72_07650 [Candidatus Omnitrophota bacterium]|nr:hypothetical protein [Candidatus Omnitrophota bacterium]
MTEKRDHYIAVKIFLTVFLISAFFFKPNLEVPRFELLTKSLAHHGTTCIDKIQQESGIHALDFFILDGRTYIEPFPGLSFIALTSYLPYSVFLRPKLIQKFSLPAATEFKVSQFMMALSTVILFTALLIGVFFLMLRHSGCTRKKAIIFSALLYFGSPFIFYSLNITNGQDILQASLLFISFAFISMSKPRDYKLVFVSGLLCGLSIFVNGVSVFLLPLFFCLLFLTKSWKNFVFWSGGALIGLLPLFIYNKISFGNLLMYSYKAKYAAAMAIDLPGAFNVARILLFSPMVGLLFFSPFVIIAVVMFKKVLSGRINKIILFAVLFYIIGLSVSVGSLCKALGLGNAWYFNQAGGGPRYLLPVIPFIFYIISTCEFNPRFSKGLASVLAFISTLINLPGLFWTGGASVVYNNLVIFCKNGFHSYMIDLASDIFKAAGLRVEGLSLFAPLAVLILFLLWLWAGDRWLRQSF